MSRKVSTNCPSIDSPRVRESVDDLSSRSNVTSISSEPIMAECVCNVCGLVQPSNSDNYCKYDYHITGFNQKGKMKRRRTLVANDVYSSSADNVIELDALDNAESRKLNGKRERVYKVTDVENPASNKDHSWDCRCTVCTCGEPDKSEDSPWNMYDAINVSKALEKWIRSNGIEGVDPRTAEIIERVQKRDSIRNPKVQYTDDNANSIIPKLVEEYKEAGKKAFLERKTETDLRFTSFLDCARDLENGKVLPLQPLKKWEGKRVTSQGPIDDSKEALESCNPRLMRHMARLGIISQYDSWKQDQWESFPWNQTSLKSNTRICCNCEECNNKRLQLNMTRKWKWCAEDGSCKHQWCAIAYKHPELVHGYDLPSSALKELDEDPLQTHIRYFSYPTKVEDTVEEVKEVSDFQKRELKKAGIEVPETWNYSDAFPFVGMVFDKSKPNEKAKEAFDDKMKDINHRNTHTIPYPRFEICEECDAVYMHQDASVDGETGKEVPERDSVMLAVSGNPATKEVPIWKQMGFSEMFMPEDTPTHLPGHDGSLTWLRRYCGIVGASKIPQWKNEDDFKLAVRNQIIKYLNEYGNRLTIISGGAEGIDSYAEEIANELGIKFLAIRPEVQQWKNVMGMKGFRSRNLEIVKRVCRLSCIVSATSKPMCYHCPDSNHFHSGGCWTMNKCAEREIPTELIEV